MVRRLLAEGHTIIACDRRESLAGDWLMQLPAEQHERVTFYPLDVSKEEQVNALAHTLGTKGIHIAYLINNAGINVLWPNPLLRGRGSPGYRVGESAMSDSQSNERRLSGARADSRRCGAYRIGRH
jgi:NAD(P)-dependent dehydrogenase (short-subunit alcohol dehydrogenase family)